MSPEEIKIQLYIRRKKVNMASIARSLGVSPTAVFRVINRQSVSTNIMAAVASAIGYEFIEVWPEHNKD